MTSSPKKILFNGITLAGGNIVPMLLKIRYWQSQNHDITIFGDDELFQQIDNLKILQKPYKRLMLEGCKKRKTLFNIITEALKRNLLALKYLKIVKNRYDIIYSISSVLDLVIFPYLLKKNDKNIKWISILDNTVPFSRPGNKIVIFTAWICFRISLFFLKKADAIYVLSEELKDFLQKQNFKNKIIFVWIGLDTKEIKSSAPSDKYNIDALFIGRIIEAKGVYDMLKVLEIITKEVPGFQLAIMGRGDENTERKFKETISEMRLENNVQFLGYKNGQEKFDIIKSSKTFLFLSHDESLGLALLEAVCCGLPCFVYDLKVFKNLYKNDEVNFFKKGDFKSIAEKIIETIKNPNLQNNIREELLAKCDWNKIAETEIASLYI